MKIERKNICQKWSKKLVLQAVLLLFTTQSRFFISSKWSLNGYSIVTINPNRASFNCMCKRQSCINIFRYDTYKAWNQENCCIILYLEKRFAQLKNKYQLLNHSLYHLLAQLLPRVFWIWISIELDQKSIWNMWKNNIMNYQIEQNVAFG